MKRRHWLPILALLAGCAEEELDPVLTEAIPARSHAMPTQENAAQAAGARAPISAVNGIGYQGGPIMTGRPTIYFIFYGDWQTILTNTAWNIFQTWAANIGSSPYHGTNSTYYDSSGNHVLNTVSYGGFWYQKTKSHGSSLQQSDIVAIVKDTIDNNQLPLDSNALYYVLTAADVSEGKFCGTGTDGYCGYHSSGNINGADIKYSFIGNPSRCPSSCMPSQNRTSSPNGNPSADAMVSVMTHELSETVTDPDLNAWLDSPGRAENGDKCAWNFGTTSAAANGSRFNVTLGGMRFLVQQNWINVNGGSCAMSYTHETLQFRDRDSRIANTGDWAPGSYKSECGWNEAVTGVSEDWGSKSAHSAFCSMRSNPAETTYSHQRCSYVNFAGGDNRRVTFTGDWDQGFVKGECAADEYVAGVSQRPDGFLNGILCCAGAVGHASCSPRYTWAGDTRESAAAGDWDYGYVKAECGPNRYVAGVARNTRPGQVGGLDAILCCQ